ncbi:hypothetical protein [Peribacillus simplex]|uniref:hypothetical protein n=1 Tax=Peribacillus simplex TaxID=1478 RepID=UPI003D2A8398
MSKKISLEVWDLWCGQSKKVSNREPGLINFNERKKRPFSIIDTLDLDVEKKAQIAMFIANSSYSNKNEDETK